MEDKWFIYYEEPHLFLHRSWTGQPVYKLTLKDLLDGAEVTECFGQRLALPIPTIRSDSLISSFRIFY